jgi:hypothetical protein
MGGAEGIGEPTPALRLSPTPPCCDGHPHRRHQFDYPPRAELPAVSFTAASCDSSFLPAVDATSARFSGTKLHAVTAWMRHRCGFAECSSDADRKWLMSSSGTTLDACRQPWCDLITLEEIWVIAFGNRRNLAGWGLTPGRGRRFHIRASPDSRFRQSAVRQGRDVRRQLCGGGGEFRSRLCQPAFACLATL